LSLYSTTTYERTEQGLVETHVPVFDGPYAFKVEVSDDNGRHYATNGLRWADEESAKHWAGGLAMRWFGCTNIRVVREEDGVVVHQTL
jgi:hypothetical protein